MKRHTLLTRFRRIKAETITTTTIFGLAPFFFRLLNSALSGDLILQRCVYSVRHGNIAQAQDLRPPDVFRFSNKHRNQDVLVTGLGLVTPLGCSAIATWEALIAGSRAGRNLTRDDIDHFDQLSAMHGLALHGATVDSPAVAMRLKRAKQLETVPAEISGAWKSEPMVAMSLVALAEAMSHARLRFRDLKPERTAIVFGSSKGGLRSAERLAEALATLRTRKPQMATAGPGDDAEENFSHSTFQFHNDSKELWNCGVQPDSATRAITALTGAIVASSCPVAACATGLIAFLQGAAMIHRGECDVCIVGSADAGLRASVLASFHRLRVTSRHRDAAAACRPFDNSRDGFVVGEGAGVAVLESRAHARSRRAKAIAKILAGGWLNDPTGMTQVDESGAVVSEVLKRMLTLDDRFPDILCLHGTGTESNDLAEARGIQTAFGADMPQCFGMKGAIGHLLGAAGSVETVLTLLALQHQQIPGTTNLTSLDERCRIPLQAQTRKMPQMQLAAKLSLGFGGHVACGLFAREL